MGGCVDEELAAWPCLGSLGGMPVRLSGLNLSIRFLLLINIVSLHRRRFARKYVTHIGCWSLMTAERYLPVIIDYCGVGQRFAVTDPVDLERAFSFFKEQGDSLGG